MKPSRCVAFVFILLVASRALAGSQAELRQMLGRDLDGAKILATRDLGVVFIDLKTRRVTKIASFPKARRFQGLSRPDLSADAREVIFSYGGRCYIANSNGSGKRRVLNREQVYSPSFWDDPKTGERCIVYKTSEGKHWYRKGRKVGATWLFRPRSRRKTKLADFPMDGGLSPDGTHLGEAYGGCLIKDLRANKMYVLYGGKQACNASMSPDNTYRIMHLYLPHSWFGIRDKFDREHWKIRNPKGSSEWQTPRWSNHPNFCMATAKFRNEYRLVVVQIDTRQTVVLHEMGGGWGVPKLWLPSAARGTALNAGPIAHLKLQKLGSYKARLATAENYMPIMLELGNRREAEAKTIIEALEKYGRAQLKAALQTEDPLDALARYREIAARFRSHSIGDLAKAIMNSAPFKKEVEAARKLKALLRLAERLHPVAGAKARFDDRAYFARNRAILVQMVGAAAEIQQRFPETLAGRKAKSVATRYALPISTSKSGNERLVVVATIEQPSRVPSYKQVGHTYTECVTFIRYRIDRVISGSCRAKKIMVVHWGMRNKKRTPAAFWKRGTRQRLTLDLFDAHKELEGINKAEDADDPDLTPYWALKVSPAR